MITKLGYRSTDIYTNTAIAKINELIDVVNKQNDILRQIGEWGTQNGQCLYCETLTSFNPPKKD